MVERARGVDFWHENAQPLAVSKGSPARKLTDEEEAAARESGRSAHGRFAPGHKFAGRPPGLSPVALAKRIWHETNDFKDVLDVVMAILRDKNERTQHRLQAADFLADRCLGKAVQHVELQALAVKEGTEVPSVDFSKFSPEELETYHDLLLKAHQGEQTIQATPLAITAAPAASSPEQVAQGELVTDGEELFGKAVDDDDDQDA